MTTEELTPEDFPTACVEVIDPRQALKDDLYAEFRCRHMGVHTFPETREALGDGPDAPEVAIFDACVICGAAPKYREIAIKFDLVNEKHGRGMSRSMKCVVEPTR